MLADNQEQALFELLEIITDLNSIDSKTDISVLLSRIVTSAVKVFDANHAGLVLFDNNKESGEIVASTSDMLKGVTFPIMVIEPKKMKRIPSDFRDSLSKLGIKSMVIVPLILGGDLIGSIGLDYQKPRSFTERQLSMMQLFANQAAIALNYLKLSKFTPKMVTTQSKYFSCFISYSAKNEEFVQKLYNDLRNRNVQCWFAPADMKIGDKIRTKIDGVIKQYDKLLLVLSESSITSQWVEQEVETALEKERRKKLTVLFPIRLDDKAMKARSGWAKYIRNTRNIGNFSDWTREDTYAESLNRLLRDLEKTP